MVLGSQFLLMLSERCRSYFNTRSESPDHEWKIFGFFVATLAITTCDFVAWRYSTNMQNANELPNDLSTPHEVIVTQAAFIHELAGKIELLS